MDVDAFFDALALVPNLRNAQFDDLEVVRRKEGFHFSGHAAVYNEEALLDEVPGMGRMTEVIARGAFGPVLETVERRSMNIPLLLEHDPTKVLATTRSGKLQLAEDQKGLSVEADLPPTSLSRDLFSLVEADVVTGMSVGFVTGPRSTGNWSIERRSNGIHRIITGFKKLLDVTTTWDPTYPSAEAQFRSQALSYVDSPESWQQLLRGAFPQRQDGATDSTEDELEGDGVAPDEEEAAAAARSESGVNEAEHRSRSIAARKRDLSFLVLTTGGIDHET